MLLVPLGQIKIGYTNDVARRAGEHGRRYGCPKQVKVLSAVRFASLTTVAEMEKQLISNCKTAGLKPVIDSQGRETERFYINPEIRKVAVKARKLTYEMEVV